MIVIMIMKFYRSRSTIIEFCCSCAWLWTPKFVLCCIFEKSAHCSELDFEHKFFMWPLNNLNRATRRLLQDVDDM